MRPEHAPQEYDYLKKDLADDNESYDAFLAEEFPEEHADSLKEEVPVRKEGPKVVLPHPENSSEEGLPNPDMQGVDDFNKQLETGRSIFAEESNEEEEDELAA